MLFIDRGKNGRAPIGRVLPFPLRIGCRAQRAVGLVAQSEFEQIVNVSFRIAIGISRPDAVGKTAHLQAGGHVNHHITAVNGRTAWSCYFQANRINARFGKGMGRRVFIQVHGAVGEVPAPFHRPEGRSVDELDRHRIGRRGGHEIGKTTRIVRAGSGRILDHPVPVLRFAGIAVGGPVAAANGIIDSGANHLGIDRSGVKTTVGYQDRLAHFAVAHASAGKYHFIKGAQQAALFRIGQGVVEHRFRADHFPGNGIVPLYDLWMIRTEVGRVVHLCGDRHAVDLQVDHEPAVGSVAGRYFLTMVGRTVRPGHRQAHLILIGGGKGKGRKGQVRGISGSGLPEISVSGKRRRRLKGDLQRLGRAIDFPAEIGIARRDRTGVADHRHAVQIDGRAQLTVRRRSGR